MTDQEKRTSNLLYETAKIKWIELQRFFAQGRVILVAEELDLVDVANNIANDSTTKIASFIELQKFSYVTDQQAKDWFENDATLWCVVVAPYVFVQKVM